MGSWFKLLTSHVKLLNFILVWAPLPLQVLLFVLMLRHASYRYFPAFFSYTLFSILATSARFLTQHEDFYPRIYWGSDAVYALLGIGVMYEVFRATFGNLTRARWFSLIFPLIAIVTFTLTIGYIHSVHTDFNTAMTWIIGGEMGIRILEVAMFIALVALVALLGLRWRQHAFGIASGFGIYASAALLASTKYYEIGSDFTFQWETISVVSYNVAVLIWLWYFATPIKADAVRGEQPPLSPQALERYKEILRRAPRP